MDDRNEPNGPSGPSGPSRAKVVKAAVVLAVIVVGTVLPLAGVGPPSLDLPDVDLPSFGFLRDVDPPSWVDGFLDVVKPVKNGVIALLVLLAAFGEYERRRKDRRERDNDAGNNAGNDAGNNADTDTERESDDETGDRAP